MITPAQADAADERDFAETCDRLAAAAKRDGDALAAEYFCIAADYHHLPSAHRPSARVRLAMAGLGRQEASR